MSCKLWEGLELNILIDGVGWVSYVISLISIIQPRLRLSHYYTNWEILSSVTTPQNGYLPYFVTRESEDLILTSFNVNKVNKEQVRIGSAELAKK